MGKTVCFTGHRNLVGKQLAMTPSAVDAILPRLYNAGFREYITGGADGFDTVAALRILKFRETHPDITLVLALPYEKVGTGAYKHTLAEADEVVYTSHRYYGGAPLDRDRYMVDRSDACVAFYIAGRESGGTYYTVCYANRKNVPVVNIAPAF